MGKDTKTDNTKTDSTVTRVYEYRLGDMKLYSVTDGTFRLDGGAMFGVVPRVIWETMNPPDAENRILMGLNPLLIVTQGKRVLVDTGIGDRLGKKSQGIYVVDRSFNLAHSFAQIGITHEDIDVVVNTHLHFDHAGGNTKYDEAGKIVPAFPNAQYFIAKGEWEDAIDPGLRSLKSYTVDDFQPLESAGVLELVSGITEIAPGVRTYPTPGHTSNHLVIGFESAGEKGAFLGDLIPTSSHIPLPYVMSYDLQPAITVETKKKILDTAFEENWLLVLEHDPVVRWGRLEKKDRGYVLRNCT